MSSPASAQERDLPSDAGPEAPKQVNSRNVVAWFVLAAIGLVCGAWWQWGDFAVLREQRRIWNDGVAVRVQSLDVEEDREHGEGAAFFFRTYHYVFEATYEVDGRSIHTRATFATLLRSLDTTAPAEVRADPRAPVRFATSWSQERLGAMACFLAWKWAVTGLWVVAMLFGALVELRPEIVAALEKTANEDDTPARHQPVTAASASVRALGAAAALVVTAGVLSFVGMFLDDLVRRFTTYLEDALGLLLGLTLLAVIGVAIDALRQLRARAGPSAGTRARPAIGRKSNGTL